MYAVESEPLPEDEFVAYVGDPDIHDGRIEKVENYGAKVQVVVHGASGRPLSVEFRGVASVRSRMPEGMILYALSEMKATAPLRRFVFVNWYDEKREQQYLEILATDFAVVHSDKPA